MRSMKALFLGCCFCLLLCASAQAADAPVLFKEFVYGMSRADVQKICNAKPIDEEGTEDLLFAPEPVKFANFDWIEAFRFNSADKLTQVLLLREEFSMEPYAALIKGLVSNGYMIANMSDGSSTLDLATALKELKSPEKLQEAVTQFESNALQNDKPLTIVLAPDNYMRKLLTSNKGESFPVSLQSAPADLRLIEVGVKDGAMTAAFTTPLLDLRKSMEGIKESF